MQVPSWVQTVGTPRGLPPSEPAGTAAAAGDRRSLLYAGSAATALQTASVPWDQRSWLHFNSDLAGGSAREADLHRSLVPCSLCAKGQLCALLSPLAGLLLYKGSRCCLFGFFLTAFDPPQALGALVSVGAQIQAWLALLQVSHGSSGCRVPGAALTALHRGQRVSSAPWQRQGRSSSCAEVCLPPHHSFLNLFLR